MGAVTPERLRELKRLRAEKDRTSKAADEAKRAFEQFQYELFADMQSANIDSMKVDGTQFVRKSTVYGQVQDSDSFRAWCQEDPERAEVFLKLTEQRARVNELVRERIDNQEELPPGVGFYAKEYVSVTESK